MRKKTRRTYRRKYKSMARRSYRRRTYYAKARKYYRRARGRGGFGSVTKNVLDGAIVGIAQTVFPDVIPMQDSLVALVVGWFRKNPTLTTLGGVQLGAQLGGMISGGTGIGTGGIKSQV